MPAVSKGHDHRARTATRPAHDERCARIWVRRGLCRPCRKTFTILPDWLSPSAQYTLRCRQQSCERISAGESLEEAAPHCQDPARLPDPSTVRRWAQRRLLSVWWWVKTRAKSDPFLQAPTILAWDLGAVCRNFPLEARSP
jgi:hypothetical protein